MYKNRFCYKISKKAEMSWDDELKEPCAAYVEVFIETEKEIPEELKESINLNFKKGLASQMETKEEYLTPITEEEYDLNN